MENEDNKTLDFFLKKLTQEAGLEEPSKDFTVSVMDKVNRQAQKSDIFYYRPLIPRYIWWFSGLVIIGLFVYIFLEPTRVIPFESNFWSLDFLDSNGFINVLANLKLPDTLAYGSLCMTIFVFLQVYLLKTRWEKQYVMD